MIWAGEASCLGKGGGAQACIALSPGTDSEVRVHAWGQRSPQVFSSVGKVEGLSPNTSWTLDFWFPSALTFGTHLKPLPAFCLSFHI